MPCKAGGDPTFPVAAAQKKMSLPGRLFRDEDRRRRVGPCAGLSSLGKSDRRRGPAPLEEPCPSFASQLSWFVVARPHTSVASLFAARFRV